LADQAPQSDNQPLRCENKHSFDPAKQGYLNLLPVQNKRSREPGDTPEMVLSRHHFLDLGHYEALSNACIQQLSHYLPNTPTAPLRLLDAGCGEGYYSQRLKHALDQRGLESDLIGVDISKAAVKAACRRSSEITWLVASCSELPLTSGGLDLIQCLFSPHYSAEFRRLLKPEGLLLMATTGSDHLLELRQLIYKDVRRDHYDPTPTLEENFLPIAQQRVNYGFSLTSNTAVLQLLAMTPHQWRTSKEARERLAQVNELELTLDINLHLFRARS
jgi:23S rRNA (guanine745-N1)-methyltransferase